MQRLQILMPIYREVNYFLREKASTDYSLIDLISTIPNNYDIVINVVVRGNLVSILATSERDEKNQVVLQNYKI